MLLSIRTYPDKILRKKAEPVLKVDDGVRVLACDMIETMHSAKGVGLAASQVGISKRIIAIEALEKNKEPLVLVNPKILKKKGHSSFCEGCLSVPDASSDVTRPEWVAVEALNLEGKLIKIETGGILARVIQHEVDHLDGVLFIDRISYFKRREILKHLHANKEVCVEM